MLSRFHIHLVSLQPRKKSLLLFNSPRLTYFFVSPKFFSFPFSPQSTSIVHCTMLCLTRPRACICICMHTYHQYRLMPSLASSFLCRLALVLKIETLTETIPHASCPDEEGLRPCWARRSCEPRNGNVSATLIALVKDSPKKSTEDDAFAHVETNYWVILKIHQCIISTDKSMTDSLSCHPRMCMRCLRDEQL
jgi:hypothetical protein